MGLSYWFQSSWVKGNGSRETGVGNFVVKTAVQFNWFEIMSTVDSSTACTLAAHSFSHRNRRYAARYSHTAFHMHRFCFSPNQRYRFPWS